MSATIPQTILDALTDVEMPRLTTERPAKETVAARGFSIPLHRSEALVLGSGAAGLRAAVEMKRRDLDVVVVTQSAFGGTSACSGSDKQTLHTANGAGRGDDFAAMADALGAGGAMDEDTAYIEAVGSLRALSSLQFMGLPIPQDRLGGALRYQTDHDEVGRATSCGPRTSRLMVQALAKEAIRLNVPIFNHMTAVRLLVERGAQQRCVGVLAISPRRRSEDNPLGLAVFSSESVVIATGGPGELYRDSVYPRHCFGSLGLAMEAGLEAVNLTESQFGIGTSRDGFPWNLSGTYVQAMPYIFSRDPRGNERNFLADYLPDDAGTGVECVPQRLPVAVPFDPHARLRLEPRRPRHRQGDARGAQSVHGFQPQSACRSGRRRIQSRPARPGRAGLSSERWSADGKAARPACAR